MCDSGSGLAIAKSALSERLRPRSISIDLSDAVALTFELANQAHPTHLAALDDPTMWCAKANSYRAILELILAGRFPKLDSPAKLIDVPIDVIEAVRNGLTNVEDTYPLVYAAATNAQRLQGIADGYSAIIEGIVGGWLLPPDSFCSRRPDEVDYDCIICGKSISADRARRAIERGQTPRYDTDQCGNTGRARGKRARDAAKRCADAVRMQQAS